MTANKPLGVEWVIAQLILFALIFAAPILLPGDAWGTTLPGILLLGGGLVVALLGLLTLGSSLSIFPRPVDDGTLVQTGIYALVRHPIYTGIILGAFGWALLWSSLPALILAAVLFVFFDRKAALEERWLSEQYADYPAYRQRVRKLIPWLY